MKDLKSNDPIMWKRGEHRFVRYSHERGSSTERNGMCWITRLGVDGNEDKCMRHVAVGELDLILEFDFGE